MATIASHRRFHELAARVDEQLREFELAPDDYVGERVRRKKRKEAVATGSGVAAGLGVVAGGGYAARRYVPGVMQKAENLVKNPKGAVRGYAHTAAGAAGQASNNLYRGALGMKEGSMLRKAAMKGSGVLSKASKGLRKVSRTFEEVVADRIVELASRIEDLRHL